MLGADIRVFHSLRFALGVYKNLPKRRSGSGIRALHLWHASQFRLRHIAHAVRVQAGSLQNAAGNSVFLLNHRKQQMQGSELAVTRQIGLALRVLNGFLGQGCQFVSSHCVRSFQLSASGAPEDA